MSAMFISCRNYSAFTSSTRKLQTKMVVNKSAPPAAAPITQCVELEPNLGQKTICLS